MIKGKRRLLTIKREMFLLSFVFLMLVSSLFLGIFLKVIYDRNIISAKNSLQQCNSQIVTYTQGLFNENAAMVEILSQNDLVINAGYDNPEELITLYEKIHSSKPDITYIYSGYADGSLYIDNYDKPVHYNSTIRPWYVAAAATDGVARLVYSDAATGAWLFSQCIKLTDDQGNMIGALAIDCSNESISQQLSTKYQYASQRSFIVDLSGNVLIHPDESNINTTLVSSVDQSVWNSIVNGRDNYAEYNNDTVKAMAYFERIPQTDFIVVTAIDASEVTKPIVSGIVFLLTLVVVMSIILGIVLSRILVHRFAYPIQILGSRIQNLALGQPDQDWDTRFANAEINGIAESIEVIVKDIASREEQRKAAEFLSFHDSMTGLYNRRFFDEELKRLDVKRNYPLSIVCCDINGLKLVNDVFGHAIGDKLIKTIASCLESSSRGDDIAARIGGDEFAIILPHTPLEDVRMIVARMKAAFPKDSLGGAQVSASFGYALKEEPGQLLEDVMRQADEMMYEQKLLESAEMKKNTVSNIITAAEIEGLIKRLSLQENHLLDAFADRLCPESRGLLKDSYRLRKLGFCTLVSSMIYSADTLAKRHTEITYMILSSLDNYRGIAGCVLHYMEHWDGSGWPAGLAGRDIPLLSRIIAVTEAWITPELKEGLFTSQLGWYDPDLVEILKEIIPSN